MPLGHPSETEAAAMMASMQAEIAASRSAAATAAPPAAPAAPSDAGNSLAGLNIRLEDATGPLALPPLSEAQTAATVNMLRDTFGLAAQDEAALTSGLNVTVTPAVYEAARSAKARLMASADFAERYLAGDPAARQQMLSLNLRLSADVNPDAPARAGAW